MKEIEITVTEQLMQLQKLTARSNFRAFTGEMRSRNPLHGQGRILALLAMKPEISQKELTYLLGMSKQSVAQSLEKLEKSGFVTREPSQEDKRVSVVRLTEEGSAEAGKSRSYMEEGGVLECLSDEELTTLSGYLERMIKRLMEEFPQEAFGERMKAMQDFRFSYEHRRGAGGRGEGHNGHGSSWEHRPEGKHEGRKARRDE